jgi:two-component system chemotaxis response regulator CheB
MADAKTSTDGTPRGVVAIGASAGGVEALIAAALSLPRELPCTVLVVLHLPAGGPSVLARIIDRSGPLPTAAAVHGAVLQAGRIYVAVPDHHLLVHDDRVILSEGPTENGHRPAINALFRSVALSAGPRAIGVLLSGVLDDGVLGSAAIRARGGTTVAQQPTNALFPAMPLNALQAGVIDHEVAAADLGSLLMRLAERDIEERHMEPDARIELRTTSRWAGGSRHRSNPRSSVRRPATRARTATGR